MTPFARSLRTLRSDRFTTTAIGLALAGVLLLAWTLWALRSQLTLHEVTPNARLEVDRATYPVQSPMLGRVTRTYLAVGRQVQPGEVLVELDTSAERLQVREEEIRLSTLTPELNAIRSQIDSEQQARQQEQQASKVAVEEARAESRRADAPAAFNAAEEERLRQLRAQGLIAEREYQRARSDAQQSKFAAEREQIVIRRIEQEQRTRESDRDSRVRKLLADVVRLEGQIATSRATIERLRNEIEKRTVRAPVGGRLGEAAILRIGAVLQEGERVGAVVPDGQLLAVAQFPPPAALGRLAPGQRAQLRLDGFPWAQWGAIPAVVQHVAGEVRDGAVRVELAIDTSKPIRIPLQHGLPGTVEVEVERTTPAALLMRVAGRMLTSPRSSFQASR